MYLSERGDQAMRACHHVWNNITGEVSKSKGFSSLPFSSSFCHMSWQSPCS
jgi:hypothetical protein